MEPGSGPRRVGHIVTVGTSLVTNKGGIRNSAQPSVVALNKMLGDGALDKPPADFFQAEGAFDLIIKALKGLNPATEFGYRLPALNAPTDRLPQELSYLWAYRVKRNKERGSDTKQPVCLLCSDTNECRNCGQVIAAVLKGAPWSCWYDVRFDWEKDYAEKVDAKRGRVFAGAGVQNWTSKVEEMIVGLRDGDGGCTRIYLNVTGGYKGTVPYSTLIGMLHPEDVTICYLFEDSPDIIFIPTYPVGVDFRKWHANALRLKMQQHNSAAQYFPLPAEVESLLKKPERSLAALGQVLEHQYKRQLDEDPLKVYSRDIIARLFGMLPNQNQAKPLKLVLHDLVKKSGDIIWLGDKIPEMVEHARRHHHDLLEFTELFLTPILHKDVKPDFLNEYELFVLLSAVLLHDCGHSLDHFPLKDCTDLADIFGCVKNSGIGKDVVLFQNDIRDYHQYLACIRLNNKKTAAALDWQGEKGLRKRHLPECLHRAVLLTCLYHRRSMAYDDSNGGKGNPAKGTLHLTGQYPPELAKHQAAGQLKLLGCPVDMMKLVALFRLIDGCDSQAHRAGPDPVVELGLKVLAEDCVGANLRAEQAKEAFTAFCDGRSSIKVDGHDCSQLADVLVEPTGTNGGWSLEDKGRSLRVACLKAVNDGTRPPDEKQCARLWLAAAEAADRAQMRFKQWPHFMKHRAVEQISVIPAKDFGKTSLNFDIVLKQRDGSEKFKSPDGREKTLDEWMNEDLFNEGKCLRQLIQDEVSGEYKSVAGYAAGLKLRATYWWQTPYDTRDNSGKPFCDSEVAS